MTFMWQCTADCGFWTVSPLVHESGWFVGQLDEGGQKVQIPGYKINKNCWGNV